MLALGAIITPVSAAQDAAEPTVIPVQHSQSGTGPCGFTIQRDLEGTVSVTPTLDGQGNLVLMIEDVDLTGTITNPENSRVVEIQWVRQGGMVGFQFEGGTSNVLLELVGTLNRGYDTADTELTMDLPSDVAETIPFVPQERNEEAWAEVCSFLSEEEPAANTGAAAA
ncbi:MAG TPA: hypothetical protein VGW38_03750 [Chloroflexota bacterium]|nr:hypothetical protein [Chloroflexota bacterium]